MHLLSTRPGGFVEDGAGVLRIEQTPAQIVILSAADTTLSLLAGVYPRLGPGYPSVRLANQMYLRQPASLDLYVDEVLQHARVVVVDHGRRQRLVIWLERLPNYARGQLLVMLSGDLAEDANLARRGNAPAALSHALWQYLREGGAANAEQFYRSAHHAFGLARRRCRRRRCRRLRSTIRRTAWRPRPTGSARRERGVAGAPVVALLFYRAHLQAGNTEVFEALAEALLAAGLCPLPLAVTSLKAPLAREVLQYLCAEHAVALVLNTTAFSVASLDGGAEAEAPLAGDAPVLQLILSGGNREDWLADEQGLVRATWLCRWRCPRWTAASSRARSASRAWPALPAHRGGRGALPAGRRAGAFRRRAGAALVPAAQLAQCRQAGGAGAGQLPPAKAASATASGWTRRPRWCASWLCCASRATPPAPCPPTAPRCCAALPPASPTTRRSTRCAPPSRAGAGRLRGVAGHLAGRQSCRHLGALGRTGGRSDGAAGPFHDRGRAQRPALHRHPARARLRCRRLRQLPRCRTGAAARPSTAGCAGVRLRCRGARGQAWQPEWLPGKSVALSPSCWPDAILGPLPHLYPFIVNDPGEGAQAKRRTQAVIIDHLMPPLTRAENYGPLQDTERLVDEYYEALAVDPRRARLLRKEITAGIVDQQLHRELGFDGQPAAADEDELLRRTDAYLCELKESQIRDGLHVFGQSPQAASGATRWPRWRASRPATARRAGRPADRAGRRPRHGRGLRPARRRLGGAVAEPAPTALQAVSGEPWRHHGDTRERLEALALELLAGLDAEDGARRRRCPGPRRCWRGWAATCCRAWTPAANRS